MSKIKIEDLKEINEGFDGVIKRNYRGSVIEIKKYLPILDKVNLVSAVVGGCINRDDGLFVVNHASKNITYKLEIVKNYTNIELPTDDIETFDLINKSGLLAMSLDNIPAEEIEELDELLENKLQEERNKYNQENRLENIVKSGINRLLFLVENFIGEDSAMDLIELSKKAVNELNPDNLEFVKEFLNANKGIS